MASEDDGPQAPPKTDTHSKEAKNEQTTRQSRLAVDEGRWRPGRSPANREINVQRRSIRLRERRNREAPNAATQLAGTPKVPGAGTKRKAKTTEAPRAEATSAESADTREESLPGPKRRRRPIPPDWKPPLVVGASLGSNLSRLEEADRLVLQWKAIIENARRTQPGADLSPFERQLEKVTSERDEMEESEENLVPVDELESTKRERIQARIQVLEAALERQKCPEGETNVRAAIKAYNEGHIECWDQWTLIYAGHLVDMCPTYESFTEDREERLDFYFQELGPGWLWYEPPLLPKDDAQSQHLFAATWAQPSNQRAKIWNGPNGWEITMGFRRVQTFHSRSAEGPQIPIEVKEAVARSKPTRKNRAKKPASRARRNSRGKALVYKPKHTGMTQQQVRGLHWAAKDETDAPRCCFLMHLDSGASVPCLYATDLTMIGVDQHAYPSQTEMTMSTANGTVNAPLYELRVDVCRHNGESLVGDDPVWPAERHELGGIVPVAVLPGASKPPKGDSGPLNEKLMEQRRQRGEDVGEEALAKRAMRADEARLSGLLPFQVCYSACAPGMRLWFGEDRRDVLGADRMPGQRRFEKHKSVMAYPLPIEWDSSERPKSITFTHEDGSVRLVDEDLPDRIGASLMTVSGEDGVKEYRLEPRRLESQLVQGTKEQTRSERSKKFVEAFNRLAEKLRPS